MDHAPLVTLEGTNGEQFALSAEGAAGTIFLRSGAQGLDMLPWDVQVDELPSRAGVSPRAVRGVQREIFLPLTIVGNTRAEMIATKRQLIRAMNPARMFVRMPKLIVSELGPDGSWEPQREIDVYYASGLEGDEGRESGLTWMRFGLVLKSTDPFFRSRSDIVADFVSWPGKVDFFPPEDEAFVSPDGTAGGFKLSADPVFADSIVVHNPGDFGVYPTWTLVGPVPATISLIREATDYSAEQSLTLSSIGLAIGQTATIATEPGQVRVTTSVAGNVTWSALGPNPTFWALDPGDNTVKLVGLPASPKPSLVSLSFRPAYLGM